jgi:hypothetical protein
VLLAFDNANLEASLFISRDAAEVKTARPELP